MLGIERVINPDEQEGDCLKRNELSGLTNGIISGWIGQTYYDLSDPEILKGLMKNIPDDAEWIHIVKSVNAS